MNAWDRYNDSEYRSLNDAIKHAIRRSAADVVMLGHLLRRMMDEQLWEGHYDSLDEYLRQELHMDYTMACRFEAINRKYSIGGRSGHIDEKWEDYSQGVLIEMLNMPPELEEKVTPDMTVRQVRELKRQARQEKKKGGAGEESVTEKPAEEASRTQVCGVSRKGPEEPDQSCGQGSGDPAEPVTDEIPDAEFREVEMPACDAAQCTGPTAQEKVATSQCPELDKPDERIRDELAELKLLLKEEQKMLDDCQEAAAEDKRVLESPMFRRQKIIVAALEAFACGFEKREPEAAQETEKVQPPLPLLKNNDQRREWLRDYKDWGLWYRDENIGVDYYKYEFQNGARLIAEVYQEEATKYHDAYETAYFHLVEGPDPPKGQQGICKWQWHGRYSRYPNSETELVEFLKEVQKKRSGDES